MNFKLIMQKTNPVKHPPKIPGLIPEQTWRIPRYRNGRINWNRVPLQTRVRIPNYIDGGYWEGVFEGIRPNGRIQVLCDDNCVEYMNRSNVEII